MSLITKSVSFLAVMAVIPASYALTARPSVIGTAASRMPTMTAVITSGGTTTVSGATTTTSTLLANAECIDAYTSCMKGGDACGPDFEECTTKVLFHGKMPQCLSTLAQCSTAGVSSLFGTGTVTALSTVASKNSYGEVTDYTYPTDGSVMGQMITGAAIANKYDTSTCVRRYTSCLKKDSVCGDDFELCTTDKEFRKQRVFCDSTLARCQSDGLIQLFGSASTSVTPSATSRIGEMIAEGAALAAVNAVSTCYKVVDQCILNACTANPYKCYENSTTATVNLVESINNGTTASENSAASTIAGVTAGMDIISKSNISSYIKNSCLDTIGSNKYCYATFLGNGQMPTASQLKDEDNQEEIFDEAYSARMSSAMKAKISDLVDQFDTKAKQKCTDTIKSCVMRVCGSGSGAACYYQTFGAGAVEKSINGSQNYETLQTGCASVVNTDAYCKYAASNPNSTGAYSYSYINNDAFSILFPEYDDRAKSDPIGAVAALNASLQNSYNDAALATMQKRCQNVATSCVRSMCGADYQNCYRNRTDVYSSLTNTGEASYDKSMNKVGGVLDYTIVLGLCLDTVKNASVCEEHLKIQQTRVAKNTTNSLWGNTVRGDWLDGGSATSVSKETVQAQDEYGNALCTSRGGYGEQACDTVDSEGNVYDQPVTMTYTSYVQTEAANSLFKELIYDLEKEAQAKYNAKLTKQQNMCMSANNGGIMGKNEMGSTFLWVKLKSNTVPKTYSASGLKATQFVPSNDLYGSFCRVRVSLQSDDKKIQDVIAKGTDWAVTYFAAGDAFTCGSWIPESALNDLANAVAKDARADAAQGNGRTKGWMTLLGVVGGGALGGVATNKMQDGAFLGGLLGTTGSSNNKDAAEQLGVCAGAARGYQDAKTLDDKSTYLTRASRAVKNLQGVDKKYFAKVSSTYCEKDTDTQACLSDLLYEASKAHRDYADIAGTTATTVTGTDMQVRQNKSFRSGTRLSGDALAQAIKSNTGLDNVTTAEEAINCEFNCDVVTNGKYMGKNGTVCDNVTKASWVPAQGNYCITKSNGGSQADKDVRYVEYTYTVYYDDAAAKTYNENLAAQRSEAAKYPEKIETARKAANTAMAALERACDTSALDSDVAKKDAQKRSITNAVGAGVGAIAGGVLAYQATKSIQDAKLDKVEKEAYDQWMNEVGQHIRCFVGGDEVGMFGDTITTSME